MGWASHISVGSGGGCRPLLVLGKEEQGREEKGGGRGHGTRTSTRPVREWLGLAAAKLMYNPKH